MATAKEGWVYKQGGLTGWNKKYVILQYNLLLIFDKEPSGSSRGQPKKTVNLSDCTLRPAEGLHSFGFQVVLPGGKTLALAAMNSQDLKEWNEKIKEASLPAPPSKNTEKKIPDRWEQTTKPPPTDHNKKGGGGGGGGMAERVPAQALQQPQLQQQQYQQQQFQQQMQFQPQQYQPQQYQPQQYQQPQQQFYQPPQQSYQQPQQAPPRSDYSAFLNPPSSVPSYNPELYNSLPSVPQSTPEQKQGQSSMFPHLRQYG